MVGTLSLPVGALAASDPLLRGLVGWYRMQGDVNDHSGKGNNGTLVNGPLTAATDKFSNSGGAYTWVYATHQYVTLANSSPLYSTTTPYSVAAWIKCPTSAKAIYCDFASTSGYAHFFLFVETKIKVLLQKSNGAALLNYVASTTTAATNTWHHIVWSDNAGAATLYIDGAADATNFTYTASALGATLDRSTIGADQNNNSQYDGSMSDVRLYNRALSAGEAHSLYAATQRI